MKARTPIVPMAFIPMTNVTAELYFTALPACWKNKLCDLYAACNPKYDPLYPIGLNSLQKNLEAWLGNVVAMSVVKRDSDDSRWLISLCPPDTGRICAIIKTWIAAEYITEKQEEPVKALAKKLISEIDPALLQAGVTSERTRLLTDDGQAVSDFSFRAFSLMTENQLVGKDISLFGETLHLCSANGEIVSIPLFYEKRGRKAAYSFVFRASVQTTPPERRCMLYIHTSIRRFIYATSGGKLFLPDNINAHIRTTADSFRILPISGDYKNNLVFWNNKDLRFYDLFEAQKLPEAEAVLRSPTNFYGENGGIQVLCPQALDTKCAEKFIVGSGVSMKDKHELFAELSSLLSSFALPAGQPEILPPLKHYKSSREQPDIVSRRERLRECTERSEIDFEIYSNSGSEKLTELLENQIREYFGEDDQYSGTIAISVRNAYLGAFGDAMEKNSSECIKQRISEIEGKLDKADRLTATFVVLPWDKDKKSDSKGDPKTAIRAGFAKTGRITQFITPEGKNPEHRAESAFVDMLRQLGYTERCSNRLTASLDLDVVGMYLLSDLMPICGIGKYDRARLLPVYVTYNPISGKVYVDCDALDRQHLLYHEALLEFSALSQLPDFTKRCNNSLQNSVKQKLLGYSNLYRNKPALFLVKADGKSRSLWNGITDKAISGYGGESCFPDKIDIGTKNSPYMLENRGGLRIVRIRTAENREVPDYFTEYDAKGNCRSASGLFRHGKIYWGLDMKEHNKEYWLSQMFNKIELPTQNFDEHSLMEFYPLMLNPGDDPEEWVRAAYILREAMPEYSISPVTLPAPLHFAKLMKEYMLVK